MDPILVSQLSKHMEEYFATNDTNNIFPTVLWAAHKAVIWGHLIELAAERKKLRLVDITRFTTELDRLYHIYTQNHAPDLLQQINNNRLELVKIPYEQTEKALGWSKAKFLLHSNSASTMFVRKLNQSIQPPYTYKLRDPHSNLISHPSEV